MASEESKKNRIMEFSFKKFTTLGIQHVTMDEISRGVGIGKGTLYKYFPSKEVLLLSTISHFAGHMENTIQEIMDNEEITPIEKLKIIFKNLAQRFSKVNPAAVAYLEHSMPEAYEKIISVRERIIMTSIIKLLEDGKKCGHFDAEMDPYVVANILIGAVNHMINPEILPSFKCTLDQLYNSIISVILLGCLTEEGRKLVNNE